MNRPSAPSAPSGRKADLVAAWKRLSPNTRGAFYMVCGALSATLMFATVKALGGRVDSFQIVFFRALAGTLVAIPMLMRSGGRGFRSAHMHLQVGNGVLGVVAMTSTYFALEHMALADATAVLFTRPLFLLLLAMLFLGEAMRVGRWLATFVGFLGVLVIVKPAGIIEVAALAIVFSALVSAVMIVLSKKMVAADGPDIQLFYFNLTMGAVLIVPTAVFWITPSWNDFGLLLLVGVFGTTNALFIVQALRVGEATAVSPFDYSRLVFAALFGFVLFSEVPDAWFWVGSAMIVVANVYIARNQS
jgi:drug/metabolite transporter (DMT)-like permease